MKLSDLPYPLRLCVEVLHYSIFHNKELQKLKCEETRQRVESLFGKDLVKEAFEVLIGAYNPHAAEDQQAAGENP